MRYLRIYHFFKKIKSSKLINYLTNKCLKWPRYYGISKYPSRAGRVTKKHDMFEPVLVGPVSTHF